MEEPRRKTELEDLSIKRNIFSLRRAFYNTGANLMAGEVKAVKPP